MNNNYQVNTKTADDQNSRSINMAVKDKDIKVIDTKKTMRTMLRDKQAQITNPGIYVNAFDIQQSDWDKSSDFFTLMQDYTNMRNGDSFVSSSVDVLLNPIINANIKVNCGKLNDEEEESDKSEEAKKYVEWTFDNLYNGIQTYHKHLLLSFYYGSAFFEQVWLKGDDYNGNVTNRLAKLAPIQMDTIQRFYYDDMAEFQGLRLWRRIPNQGSRWVDILDEQIHRCTPFEEFNNVEGRSIIRPIRFTWNIKQQLLKSQARSASRGAGIPVITLGKGVNENATVLGSKVKEIIQTVGNSENCGVIDQEGVFTFRLEGLKSQENNMALLDFCNSEIVYNTLTQFLISGIGSNGSRSATDSHKSSYQDALNADIKIIENNYNDLVRKIIENSYLFGQIDTKEYPYITLDRPADVDLTATADNWVKLVQASGVTPTKEDEKYFRSVFGYPEIQENEMQDNKEVLSEETKHTDLIPEVKPEEIKPTENNSNTDKVQKVTQEQMIKLEGMKKSTTYNQKINIKHGIDFLNKTEPEVQDIIKTHYKEMLDFAKHQLKLHPDKPIVINDTLRTSLYNSLNKYYNEAFKQGYTVSKQEVEKLVPGNKLYKFFSELAKGTGALKLSTNGNKLEYVIKLLGDNIENQINTRMLNTNSKIIEKKGGIDNFIDELFTDSQKQAQATLLNNTMSGYVEGRHEAQTDFETETGNKIAKTYTLQLERQNVCEVCFPYEGIVFTQDEAEGLGLNWDGSPLNPECLGLLGKNQCQCTWGPEEVIEG